MIYIDFLNGSYVWKLIQSFSNWIFGDRLKLLLRIEKEKGTSKATTKESGYDGAQLGMCILIFQRMYNKFQCTKTNKKFEDN